MEENKVGWMGMSVEHRPSNEELNTLVGDWTAGDNYTNVDRSGWMNHGRHMFVLTERRPPGAEPVRFIMVVKVERTSTELRWRLDDESVCPKEHDCPTRLMRGLDGHEPVNEYARQWRERVLQFHQRTGRQKSVLRALREQYPDGEQTVVLMTGETVRYDQRRHRGKRNLSAHRPTRPGALQLLRPNMIDAVATRAVWTEAREKRAKEKEATANRQARLLGE